jgi:hypothetical protein
MGKCEIKLVFQSGPIFKAPILSCFLHVSHVILEIPNSTSWIVNLMTFSLANAIAIATYSKSCSFDHNATSLIGVS